MKLTEELIDELIYFLNNDINVILNEDFYIANTQNEQSKILNKASAHIAQIEILKKLKLLIKNDPRTIEEYELENFPIDLYSKVQKKFKEALKKRVRSY